MWENWFNPLPCHGRDCEFEPRQGRFCRCSIMVSTGVFHTSDEGSIPFTDFAKNLQFSKFFAIIFIENETKNANENDCGLQTNIEMSDSRRNWTPQKTKGDTTVPDS